MCQMASASWRTVVASAVERLKSSLTAAGDSLILGAIFAGGVALAFHGEETRLVLVLMFFAGALGGMLWAAIPALLRTRLNTNEILVSLMLVYVASLLLSWGVREPGGDPEGVNNPPTKQ